MTAIPGRGSQGCYNEVMSVPITPAAFSSDDRLVGIGLCVLVDGCGDVAAFRRLVETLFAAGLPMLQVRDKRLPTPALVERVRIAVAAAERRGACRPVVIVNDRADVAAVCGADGVHVGADDLPVPLARRVVGEPRLVGRTAHDLAAVHRAVAEGADYLGIGPCFPSVTKAFAADAPRGFLTAAVRESSVPAFAIGGVTLDRLEELAALGITRVAVAAAITAAVDPAAATTAFLNRLNQLSKAPPERWGPPPAPPPAGP